MDTPLTKLADAVNVPKQPAPKPLQPIGVDNVPAGAAAAATHLSGQYPDRRSIFNKAYGGADAFEKQRRQAIQYRSANPGVVTGENISNETMAQPVGFVPDAAETAKTNASAFATGMDPGNIHLSDSVVPQAAHHEAIHMNQEDASKEFILRPSANPVNDTLNAASERHISKLIDDRIATLETKPSPEQIDAARSSLRGTLSGGADYYGDQREMEARLGTIRAQAVRSGYDMGTKEAAAVFFKEHPEALRELVGAEYFKQLTPDDLQRVSEYAAGYLPAIVKNQTQQTPLTKLAAAIAEPAFAEPPGMDAAAIRDRLTAEKLNHAVVGAGGAMVMRGHKPYATDIDATLSPEDFEAIVKERGLTPGVSRMGSPTVKIGDIELFAGELPEHDDMDGLKVESHNSLKDFYTRSGRPKDAAALAILNNAYDPPYTMAQILKHHGQDVYNRLKDDPVHKWRADNGVELIHKEPDAAEQQRIWENWQRMAPELKKRSDAKALEMFGKTNAELHAAIIRNYESQKQATLTGREFFTLVGGAGGAGLGLLAARKKGIGAKILAMLGGGAVAGAGGYMFGKEMDERDNYVNGLSGNAGLKILPEGPGTVTPGMHQIDELRVMAHPGASSHQYNKWKTETNAARANEGLKPLAEGPVNVSLVNHIQKVNADEKGIFVKDKVLNLPQSDAAAKEDVRRFQPFMKELNGYSGPAYDINKDRSDTPLSLLAHEVQHHTGRSDPVLQYPMGQSYPFYDINGKNQAPGLIPYDVSKPIEVGPGLHDMHFRAMGENSGVPNDPEQIIHILANGSDRDVKELASRLGNDGKRFVNMALFAKNTFVSKDLRKNMPAYKLMETNNRAPNADFLDDFTNPGPTGTMPTSQVIYDLIRAYWRHAAKKPSIMDDGKQAVASLPLTKLAATMEVPNVDINEMANSQSPVVPEQVPQLVEQRHQGVQPLSPLPLNRPGRESDYILNKWRHENPYNAQLMDLAQYIRRNVDKAPAALRPVANVLARKTQDERSLDTYPDRQPLPMSTPNMREVRRLLNETMFPHTGARQYGAESVTQADLAGIPRAEPAEVKNKDDLKQLFQMLGTDVKLPEGAGDTPVKYVPEQAPAAAPVIGPIRQESTLPAELETLPPLDTSDVTPLTALANMVKTAAVDSHGKDGKRWHGVDFDGTVSHYEEWISSDHVGKPIQKMVDRINKWLDDGEYVQIVTARVHPDNPDAETARHAIQAFCKKHFKGRILKVRCDKDSLMIDLYDDRAVQVDPNTGERSDGGESDLLEARGNSCLMALPTMAISARIMRGALLIPFKDIYRPKDPKYGRELTPHITVKYGVNSDSIEDVEPYVRAAKVTLGKLGWFDNESDPYIVLRYLVESDDLKKLHVDMKEIEDPEVGERTFRPHMTVAYLKRDVDRGAIIKMVSDASSVEGRSFTVGRYWFNDRKGRDRVLKVKE